jgi:hypothetical protein
MGLVKHGMYGSRTYSSYRSMLRRCYSESHDTYHMYGGRGIKVCDRWKDSFAAFYEDMGKRPEGMSLDRVDNNGDYDKENCRWATAKMQCRNTRRNRIVNVGGQQMSLQEASEIFGVKRETIAKRLNSGLTDAASVKAGKRQKRLPVVRKGSTLYTWQDRVGTLAYWCRELGIPYGRTKARIRKGWSFIDAITKERRGTTNERR